MVKSYAKFCKSRERKRFYPAILLSGLRFHEKNIVILYSENKEEFIYIIWINAEQKALKN